MQNQLPWFELWALSRYRCILRRRRNLSVDWDRKGQEESDLFGSEFCDGSDNNCDDSIDEGLAITAFIDTDGDLYGDTASQQDVYNLESDY